MDAAEIARVFRFAPQVTTWTESHFSEMRHNGPYDLFHFEKGTQVMLYWDGSKWVAINPTGVEVFSKIDLTQLDKGYAYNIIVKDDLFGHSQNSSKSGLCPDVLLFDILDLDYPSPSATAILGSFGPQVVQQFQLPLKIHFPDIHVPAEKTGGGDFFPGYTIENGTAFDHAEFVKTNNVWVVPSNGRPFAIVKDRN